MNDTPLSSLSAVTQAALEKHQIDSLNDIQLKALNTLSAGGYCIWAPTGSGKTLANLISAEESGFGATLYVTSTLELAEQVAEVVRSFTLPEEVLEINRSSDYKRVRKALEAKPKWVVATLGRLEKIIESAEDLVHINQIIVDEADSILREDKLERLESALEKLDISQLKRVVMSSATFQRSTLKAAETYFKRSIHVERVYPEESAQAPLQLIPSDDNAHKLRQLVLLFDEEPAPHTIIFSNKKSVVASLDGKLRYHKHHALCLHGDVDNKVRQRVVDTFKNDPNAILVCTDVAARGIDIPGVTRVIHLDVPNSLDDFIHRNGRAGRHGEDVTLFALSMPSEWNRLCSYANRTGAGIRKKAPPYLMGVFKGPQKTKASGKIASKKKRKKTSKKKAK